MIRNINKAILIVSSIFGALQFASCNVAEDMSDCSANFTVSFSFTRNGTEAFGREVPSMDLFVFDQNGIYVGTWSEDDNSKFEPGYQMIVPLKPDGEYTFVAWGGLNHEQFEIREPVVGKTSIDELMLNLKCRADGNKNIVDKKLTSLFYGTAKTAKTKTTDTDLRVKINLFKNTNQVNLTIVGLYAHNDADNRFEITLESPNGGYDFYNHFGGQNPTMTYIPQDSSIDADKTYTSTLYTKQLIFGRSCNLNIRDTQDNSLYYSVDILEDYLRKTDAYNTQAKLDAENVFNIEIDLSPFVGAKIKVNGWDVQDSVTDID